MIRHNIARLRHDRNLLTNVINPVNRFSKHVAPGGKKQDLGYKVKWSPATRPESKTSAIEIFPQITVFVIVSQLIAIAFILDRLRSHFIGLHSFLSLNR